MAVDGTWRRTCKLLDISVTGARLLLEDSIEGLRFSEFILMLSANGRVYRRCELIRVNGDQLGVHFLKASTKAQKKRASKGERADND
jgi:hypothetical protein